MPWLSGETGDFTPKQAIALDTPNGYKRTGGLVTSQIARECVALTPPVTSTSVIHDNACGNGQVTSAILTNTSLTESPAPGLKILATDLSPTFLSALRREAEARSWPVETALLRSENLVGIPDANFSHSFNNFGIFMTANGGLDAARETYRTLAPGGVAVLTCWRTISWLRPITAVHQATRPGVSFPRPKFSWNDGTHLCDILREAGFDAERTKITTVEAVAETTTEALRDWAETAWAILGGQPCGGWREGDEEKWDGAVELLVEKLEQAEGVSIAEDGAVKMKYSANVVVATK